MHQLQANPVPNNNLFYENMYLSTSTTSVLWSSRKDDEYMEILTLRDQKETQYFICNAD